MYPGFPGSNGGAVGNLGYASGLYGAPVGMEQYARQQGSANFSMQAGAGLAGAAINGLPMMAGLGIGLGGLWGGALQSGARTGFGQVAGTIMNGMDPTTYLPTAMGAGFRFAGNAAGFGAASQGFGAAASAAWAGGSAEMMGFGAATAGGLAAGAGLLGAAYLATEAAKLPFKLMAQGAQGAMSAQVMTNSIMPSALPGGGNMSAGSSYSMLRDAGTSLKMGPDEMGGLLQGMDRAKLFQTTSSMREFQSRFKEVVGALKEIAQVTQTSIEDALNTITSLRGQGFSKMGDLVARAKQVSAQASITGLSEDQVNAIGQVGSNTARQYGMYGKVGAGLMTQSVTNVATALRSGRMSEEMVNEHGGAEAVGMRMSQASMGFLGTARGRAMIAYGMGADGAPDASRLAGLLSGNMSLDGIVEGAAGRGLGTLVKAGSRESKEAFAQFAPAAMVAIAAAQSNLLHGGISQKSMIQMLGTMGLGRDEAMMMMQSVGNTGATITAQNRQMALEDARATQTQMQERYGAVNVAKRSLNSAANVFRDTGASLYEAASNWADRTRRGLMGGNSYTGSGTEALARGYRPSGGFGIEKTSGDISISGGSTGMALGLAIASGGGSILATHAASYLSDGSAPSMQLGEVGGDAVTRDVYGAFLKDDPSNSRLQGVLGTGNRVLTGEDISKARKAILSAASLDATQLGKLSFLSQTDTNLSGGTSDRRAYELGVKLGLMRDGKGKVMAFEELSPSQIIGLKTTLQQGQTTLEGQGKLGKSFDLGMNTRAGAGSGITALDRNAAHAATKEKLNSIFTKETTTIRRGGYGDVDKTTVKKQLLSAGVLDKLDTDSDVQKAMSDYLGAITSNDTMGAADAFSVLKDKLGNDANALASLQTDWDKASPEQRKKLTEKYGQAVNALGEQAYGDSLRAGAQGQRTFMRNNMGGAPKELQGLMRAVSSSGTAEGAAKAFNDLMRTAAKDGLSSEERAILGTGYGGNVADILNPTSQKAQARALANLGIDQAEFDKKLDARRGNRKATAADRADVLAEYGTLDPRKALFFAGGDAGGTGGVAADLGDISKNAVILAQMVSSLTEKLASVGVLTGPMAANPGAGGSSGESFFGTE